MIIDKHVPGRPGHYVLRAAHPEDVNDFYCKLLGWTLETDGTFSLRGHTVARLTAAAGGWLPYLAVADADAALAEAVAAGAATVQPATTDAVGRVAVVTAPGGAELGLWEAGSGTGVECVAEPGAVVWIEEKTFDQAADTAFLSAVFGYEVLGVEGPGKVRVLKGEGPLFSGVMKFDDRWELDEHPHWLLYIAVDPASDGEVLDGVDGAVEAVGPLGGSVWFPPFQTPLGRMAYLRDPTGNPFAVVALSQQGREMTGSESA